MAKGATACVSIKFKDQFHAAVEQHNTGDDRNEDDRNDDDWNDDDRNDDDRNDDDCNSIVNDPVHLALIGPEMQGSPHADRMNAIDTLAKL